MVRVRVRVRVRARLMVRVRAITERESPAAASFILSKPSVG